MLIYNNSHSSYSVLCTSHSDLCMVKMFISQGGETPADVAIRMGHDKVVDALLQSGIDINIDKKVSYVGALLCYVYVCT